GRQQRQRHAVGAARDRERKVRRRLERAERGHQRREFGGGERGAGGGPGGHFTSRPGLPPQGGRENRALTARRLLAGGVDLLAQVGARGRELGLHLIERRARRALLSERRQRTRQPEQRILRVRPGSAALVGIVVGDRGVRIIALPRERAGQQEARIRIARAAWPGQDFARGCL